MAWIALDLWIGSSPMPWDISLATVEVQVSAVMPGFRVKSDVSTSVGLAETVIMGVTPQQFAQLGDADNWKYGFGG